jgi:hypothetical protein
MSNDIVFTSVESQDSAWKSLDEVVRKWVALSGHEKDQEDYQKRRKEALTNRRNWQD